MSYYMKTIKMPFSIYERLNENVKYVKTIEKSILFSKGKYLSFIFTIYQNRIEFEIYSKGKTLHTLLRKELSSKLYIFDVFSFLLEGDVYFIRFDFELNDNEKYKKRLNLYTKYIRDKTDTDVDFDTYNKILELVYLSNFRTYDKDEACYLFFKLLDSHNIRTLDELNKNCNVEKLKIIFKTLKKKLNYFGYDDYFYSKKPLSSRDMVYYFWEFVLGAKTKDTVFYKDVLFDTIMK